MVKKFRDQDDGAPFPVKSTSLQISKIDQDQNLYSPLYIAIELRGLKDRISVENQRWCAVANIQNVKALVNNSSPLIALPVANVHAHILAQLKLYKTHKITNIASP